MSVHLRDYVKDLASRKAHPGPSGGTHVTPPSQSADADAGAPEHGPILGYWPSQPKLVSSGVDSLYLAFYARIAPEIMEQLEARKRAAQGEQDSAKGALIALGGEAFSVAPFGKPRFGYLLANERMTVAIGRRKGDPTTGVPAVYIKARASWLWAHPGRALGVFHHIQKWVTGLHVGEAAPRAILSRLDVAADMIGLDFQLEDFNHFVTRGVANHLHYDHEWDDGASRWLDWDPERGEAVPAKAWRTGRKFTGFRFGQDKIVVRIYDKTQEIKVSGKQWFEGLWAPDRQMGAAGPSRHWNFEKVWRVEMQCRREAIKEFTLVDEETGEELKNLDPETILKNLTALWRYVVGAPKALGDSWLRLAIPSESRSKKLRQSCRWKTRPEWEAYQSVDFGTTQAHASREHQAHAQEEPLIAQALGITKTIAALRGFDTLAAALAHVSAAATVRAFQKGGDFAKEVKERALELKAVRDELETEEKVGWEQASADDLAGPWDEDQDEDT